MWHIFEEKIDTVKWNYLQLLLPFKKNEYLIILKKTFI